MRLNAHEKSQLLTYARQVYLGYIALDFIKTKAIANTQVLDRHQSVLDVLQQMDPNADTEQNLYIAGKHYQCKFKPRKDGRFDLSLTHPIFVNLPSIVQPINQYTDEQSANLLTHAQYIYERTSEGEWAISVALSGENNRNIVIGGPKKIDVYRTHLVTLRNMIHKIDSEENLSALLVALATGTGKTFVQALWIETLYLANFTGIFGVPDQLILQFIQDMRKVLPEDLVQQILPLRRQNPSAQAKHALNNLHSVRCIIVADSQTLINHYYSHLLAAPSDHTFLSVDEQHNLMQDEKCRQRLLHIPHVLLSLFLTATPTQETYRLAGEQPVATMSSRQKQEAGQGRLPRSTTLEVPFLTDLNWKHTKNWWQWAINKIRIALPNQIIPERSSAAQYAIERIPFQFHYDTENSDVDHTNLRWNLHVSMARKILCIIDDNECLVNFIQHLRNPRGIHPAGVLPDNFYAQRNNAPYVYSNGGFEPNGLHLFVQSLEESFGHTRSPRGTELLIRQERKATWTSASEQLPDEAAKTLMQSIIDAGLATQLQSNMFHYLIEYVLSDLTGLDKITLDRMRKHQMPDLIALVTSKSNLLLGKNTPYYQQELEQVIDKNGARSIAALLNDLALYLKQLIPNHRSDALHRYIDNWFLDSSIYQNMNEDPSHCWGSFCVKFDTYAETYLAMAVMENMEAAETPIPDSRPFFAFAIEERKIFDKSGRLHPNAKKRPRNSIQKLAGMITGNAGYDTVLTPNLLCTDSANTSLTPEDIAKNYFRLGFVGVFVSNKMHQGYSDSNVHTVVNIAEHTISPNNAPEVIIQGYGRDRGLNETVISEYLHVLGHQQINFFNPRLLEQDNYYPSFFTAQAQHNEHRIDLLGVNLAKDIQNIYLQHRTPGKIYDPILVHIDITTAITKFLRDLNNANSHDLRLSRSQLARVINKAMAVLNTDIIERLKDPYALSPVLLFFGRITTGIAKTVCSFYYASENKQLNAELSQHEHNLDHTPQSAYNRAYVKIIRHISVEKLAAHVLPVLELWAWTETILTSLQVDLIQCVQTHGLNTNTLNLQSGIVSSVIELVQYSLIHASSAAAAKALIMTHLEPLLFHPQTLSTYQLVIGQLSQDDLCALFTAAAHPNPPAAAARILALNTILQTQNTVRFTAEFLTAPAENQLIPVMHIIEELTTCSQIIMNAYMHFNQCTLVGGRAEGPIQDDPLLNHISDELKDICRGYRENEISILRSKGICTAATNIRAITSTANREDIANLTRIKNHILRPIWWTLNVSKWGVSIVQSVKNGISHLREWGLFFWNKIQQGIHWFRCTLANFRPATQNPISASYDTMTFELVQDINDLKPFAQQDVIQKNCAQDSIVSLEQRIARRKEQRMFVSPPTAPGANSNSTPSLRPLQP